MWSISYSREAASRTRRFSKLFSMRSSMTARSVQLSALRSNEIRWLAVIIVTDLKRSAEARSRQAAPVSLINPPFADALGVATSREFASLFMGRHLLASGST